MNLILKSCLLIVFLVTFSVTVLASYYDQRPRILDVQALDFPQLKSGDELQLWAEASRGHFMFLAQTLAFFPEHEYFFLARDVEYVYDIAQVLFRHQPELLNRIHLVPISRDIINLDELKSYLAQEGLSKENLQDRPALFIDSCCLGTIPNRIAEIFKNEKIQIKSFFMSKTASLLGSDGREIEELSHYTESAIGFSKNGEGHIRVHSALSKESTRMKSQQIIGKIRFDYDNPQARRDFNNILENMQEVFSFFTQKLNSKSGESKAVVALTTLAKKYSIPIGSFLHDIDTVIKEYYGPAVKKNRISDFILKYPEIKKIADASEVLNVALHPQLYEDWLEVMLEYHFEKSEKDKWDWLLSSAVELLTKSTPKTLKMTANDYNNLIRKWMNILNDSGSSQNASRLSKLLSVPSQRISCKKL